jgi:hypothetical protein
VNVTELPVHTVVAGVDILTEGITDGFMVIVIELDVAVAGSAQAELEVMTQVTACPLVSAVVVKVALLVPALVPSTFHWYDGVLPPLVGVAVNVTELPLHTVVLGVEIVTDGVTVPVTVIVSELDVAVVGDAQPELEVKTQVTACPLVRAVVV